MQIILHHKESAVLEQINADLVKVREYLGRFGVTDNRYVRSFDDIESDVKEFFEAAKEKDPQLNDKPVFLTGFSMGGSSAFYIALKDPSFAKGIIAFAPGFKLMVLFNQCQNGLFIGQDRVAELGTMIEPLGTYEAGDFSFQSCCRCEELGVRLMNDKLMYLGKFR